MNSQNLITRSLFIAIVGLACSATIQARPEVGGDFADNATTDRSGTYRDLDGSHGTFKETATRSGGITAGTLTWTDASGGTGTYTFADSWNEATKTGTHSSSTNYPDGKTSSSQGTLTETSGGVYTYTGTHVRTDGQLIDVSKAITEADGVRTVDTTDTDTSTGKTKTSDQVYTETSNGYTQTGTVTGYDGKTRTDQKTVTVIADPDGKITRTMTGTITESDGTTKDIGSTETYTQTVTPILSAS